MLPGFTRAWRAPATWGTRSSLGTINPGEVFQGLAKLKPGDDIYVW
jgi:hypothetical protein